MRLTCCRRLQFCIAHRVVGHEGECAHVHGHNYVVYVHAESREGLDDLGRVVDFSVLKMAVGGWIDHHWDHGVLLYEHDSIVGIWSKGGALEGHKHYLLPHNPTAENIARFLIEDVCPVELAGSGVDVFKVVVHETENCSAEATEVIDG